MNLALRPYHIGLPGHLKIGHIQGNSTAGLVQVVSILIYYADGSLPIGLLGGISSLF